MSAIYTLAVVYRDGNPQDRASFGEDLPRALRALDTRRRNGDFLQEHWMVYDADDPERGYFEDE